MVKKVKKKIKNRKKYQKFSKVKRKNSVPAKVQKDEKKTNPTKTDEK